MEPVGTGAGAEAAAAGVGAAATGAGVVGSTAGTGARSGCFAGAAFRVSGADFFSGASLSCGDAVLVGASTICRVVSGAFLAAADSAVFSPPHADVASSTATTVRAE